MGILGRHRQHQRSAAAAAAADRLAGRGQRRRRGIVLVAVCLSLLLMLAGLGLGVDLNRFLAARAAMASRAEAVALGAALELDGTAAGLERARARAQGAAASGLTVEFSQAPAAAADGSWQADPLHFAEVRAVRVRGSGEMPLSILRGMVDRSSLPLRVTVRAEQRPMERVDAGAGLLPWAMAADERTTTSSAPGTTLALPAELTAQGAELKDGGTRKLILSGVPGAVRIGDRLPALVDPTPRVTAETLDAIIAADTDPVSSSYAAYADAGRGNGRRLVLLPLVDAERRVTGFAGFFLLAGGRRVETVRSYLQGSRFPAVARAGAWRAELVVGEAVNNQ